MVHSVLKAAFATVLTALLGSEAHASGEDTTRFCEAGDVLQPAHGQALWGPASVQHYIRALLQKPHVIDRPAASYALTYLTMTAERDKERCGGMLAADDSSDELIGDLLADVMSRWLVLSTDACLQSAAPKGASLGICGATRRSVDNRFDTLRSALEVTSVYLSSHMASALAAVILSDTMWTQSFPENTHCPKALPCPMSVIQERIKYVRSYKTLYDKNNGFLAKHISTVISTLKRACYVKTGLASAGAPFVNNLPINALVFGHLRDLTFESAIKLASSLKRQNHPMLRQTETGEWALEYSTYRGFSLAPTGLLELEAHARNTFANASWSWILKPLGGLDATDLSRLQPSQNPACLYPRPF